MNQLKQTDLKLFKYGIKLRHHAENVPRTEPMKLSEPGEPFRIRVSRVFGGGQKQILVLVFLSVVRSEPIRWEEEEEDDEEEKRMMVRRIFLTSDM